MLKCQLSVILFLCVITNKQIQTIKWDIYFWNLWLLTGTKKQSLANKGSTYWLKKRTEAWCGQINNSNWVILKINTWWAQVAHGKQLWSMTARVFPVKKKALATVQRADQEQFQLITLLYVSMATIKKSLQSKKPLTVMLRDLKKNTLDNLYQKRNSMCERIREHHWGWKDQGVSDFRQSQTDKYGKYFSN